MKLALTLLIACSMLFCFVTIGPGTRVDSIGRLRQEASFGGRSTSYWHEELLNWEVQAAVNEHRPCGLSLIYTRSPTFSDTFYCMFFRPVKSAPICYPLLIGGDAAAIPVLIELLAAHESIIRLIAVDGLGRLGKAADTAIPVLLLATKDVDDKVRNLAEQSLLEIDPTIVLYP